MLAANNQKIACHAHCVCTQYIRSEQYVHVLYAVCTMYMYNVNTALIVDTNENSICADMAVFQI